MYIQAKENVHFIMHSSNNSMSFLFSAEHVGLKHLGSILFELTISSVFLVEEKQIKIPSESMALLQASSCFGNHRASLLLATIYLSGLGHPVNQEKVEAYHTQCLPVILIAILSNRTAAR